MARAVSPTRSVSQYERRSARISALLGDERYDDVIALSKANLAFDPESAWHHAQISMAAYEKREYARALRRAERAVELQPDDPLALWCLGVAHEHCGNSEAAIEVFRRVVRRGDRRVGLVDCTEGLGWARSLINDCRYRLGLCYLRLGRRGPARRWLRAHLEHRAPGRSSLYTLAEARRALRRVEGV